MRSTRRASRLLAAASSRSFSRPLARPTWTSDPTHRRSDQHPPGAGKPYPALDNVGIARLCFEVKDIDAAAAHLAANGVEFVGPVSLYETAPGVRPEGVEARFVCFKDPDGTILEYAEFAGDAIDVLNAPKR